MHESKGLHIGKVQCEKDVGISSYHNLQSGRNKERKKERKKEEYEKWHFHDRTLLRLAVFRVAFGHLYESCWSQSHSKRKPGRLNKLLACLW